MWAYMTLSLSYAHNTSITVIELSDCTEEGESSLGSLHPFSVLAVSLLPSAYTVNALVP